MNIREIAEIRCAKRPDLDVNEVIERATHYYERPRNPAPTPQAAVNWAILDFKPREDADELPGNA